MKDVQAAGEASSPKREHPALENNAHNFSFFLVIYANPGSGFTTLVKTQLFDRYPPSTGTTW
jgi:hypothetical protein